MAVRQMNGLVAAIDLAFINDLPLTLSPDDLWMAIVQGLSLHINENAEALRSKFVSHEGKVTLTVRRDGFIKGETNDWPGVFHEFSDQIAEYINKKRDLIVADFSTTGPLEKIASEITLMEAMKNYFDYRVMTLCYIPRITLLGETKDWENIKQRVLALEEFDLKWWTDHLAPIVEQFVDASQGKIDTEFWKSIYKLDGGSGGPYINGWITQLFPYVYYSNGYHVSDLIGKWRNKRKVFGGLTSDILPSGLSIAPFTWEYYLQKFSMEFIGGFLGVSQENDSSLRPRMGWVVRYCK